MPHEAQCRAMAGAPDERPRCGTCGAAHPPDASVCPLCGASLAPPPPASTDALLRELEALTKAVAEERPKGVAIEAGARVAGKEEAKPPKEPAKGVEEVLAEVLAGIPPTTAEPAKDAEVPPPKTEPSPPTPAAPKPPDLADFVRNVERTVAARARRPARPPQPSLAAAPLLTFGGLVLATGLFLIPATAFVGVVTASAGLALLFMGGMLRRVAPPRPVARTGGKGARQ